MANNVYMGVDLDSCLGCYACQNACKMVNDLGPWVQWLKVTPRERQPEEYKGKLYMDRFPVPLTLEACADCPDRQDGSQPLCATVCMGRALIVGNRNEVMDEMEGKRAVIFTSKE